MEFDISLFLISICLAFALGWMAARFDFRQLKKLNKTNPKSYFKGLTLLLNEQQDKAIDAFIDAVRNDPEATELYFSLGSLFSRRGEHTNAVRVHQHLLSRADINKLDRRRATYALALDYLHAGILNNAEDMLRKLVNTKYEQRAQLALLSIYERSQEWSNAILVTIKLQQLSGGGHVAADRRAHYECEQARMLQQQHQSSQALILLQNAAKDMPDNARIRFELGKLFFEQQNWSSAYDCFQTTFELNQQLITLFAQDLMHCAKQLDKQQLVAQQLKQFYQQYKSVDVADVIYQYLADCPHVRKDILLNKLQLQPSLLLVQRWLSADKFNDQQYYQYMKESLLVGVKYLKNYRCRECNFESQTYFWHCPGCQSWESFSPRRVEEQ